MLFHFRQLVQKTYHLLKTKMVRGLEEGIKSNRAKINYMQIIWETQLEKLRFDYIKKNAKKKGEYSQMISALTGIRTGYRDRFLIRYIARCKLANALAFFQWRCLTLEDPEEVEKNKKIFEFRVQSLINNINSSIEKKTVLNASFKENEKSAKRKQTMELKQRKGTLRSLETSELIQM